MYLQMESLFRTEILGFNSGENYTVSISPKLSNSYINGPSKWLSVNTPDCLQLYKSVDRCGKLLNKVKYFF